MFRFRDALATALIAASAALPAQAQDKYPGIGRAATPKEVAAWDIDVRPDFKGLPPGSGTVARGQDLWEERCAVCHGVFGESNTIFTPLVGGTTADDVKTGRVATLKRSDYPGRTSLMKVPTVSTLWDYIHRAMPWDKPKSLKPDEVYALTAFLLNLGHVVPDNFTLSDKNIAEVQQKMPNRNGMTTAHALWPGKELPGPPATARLAAKGSRRHCGPSPPAPSAVPRRDLPGHKARPDVEARACMSNWGPAPAVTSVLPEHARNNHGNLREQNRTVGPQRGSDTTKPEGWLGDAAGPVKVVGPASTDSPNAAAIALTQKHACTACHNMSGKLVGPGFADIAAKHAGKADYLAGKIKAGGSGVWGEIPMPPQELPEADTKAMAAWLAGGAGK